MMPFWLNGIAKLQEAPFLKALGVRDARSEAWRAALKLEGTVEAETVWFHAASVGELEMLRALIDDFTARGIKVGVTCFSDSALKALSALKDKTVYAALSPKETEWGQLFDHFKVNKLIVSKYDLWPGLALAAAKRNVPVIVINARMGGGLKILRSLFQFSGEKLPRFHFFSARKKDATTLQDFSKDAPIELSVDPRFERVARRVEVQDKREQVQEWIRKLASHSKPYGIVGSAWIEDLALLAPALHGTEDTLLVVPHDLIPSKVDEMRAFLNDELPGRFVIVDQMGLLVELYALADWVFVGGGYGKGVHSTLEPSVYSVPIACGPIKVEDFPETDELIENSVLTVCNDEADIRKWHQSLKTNIKRTYPSVAEKRERYRTLLEECLRIR